jgi:hypothetical protein
LVNGTYQVFYGYQIANTIYNANWVSYTNQTINNNINFDDGYLAIQNCTINGNIKITQGNVLFQDCNISGNIKIDLGRIRILNCNINGNLETKNADLEMRYTQLNGNVNAKLSSYECISEIIIGNDINGNLKIKGGTCYIVGNTINGNINVDDPTIIQQVIDNDVTGNIKLNDNLAGFDGYHITNSINNVQYPQCAVDPITGLGYVLWLEYGVELYYVGTEDFVTWSQPTFLGVLSVTGNPELDVSAYNGNLMITWEYGGTRTYESDIDWDFIPDVEDAFSMEYNIIPGDSSFVPDAASFNRQLGLSVAIDYANNNTFAPIISSSSAPMLNGSIGTYFDITINSSGDFKAIIKLSYNPANLPANYTEELLGMYWYDSDNWKLMSNITLGEDTDVDLNNHYIWASTNQLSSFTGADVSFVDSDGVMTSTAWQ